MSATANSPATSDASPGRPGRTLAKIRFLGSDAAGPSHGASLSPAHSVGSSQTHSRTSTAGSPVESTPSATEFEASDRSRSEGPSEPRQAFSPQVVPGLSIDDTLFTQQEAQRVKTIPSLQHLFSGHPVQLAELVNDLQDCFMLPYSGDIRSSFLDVMSLKMSAAPASPAKPFTRDMLFRHHAQLPQEILECVFSHLNLPSCPSLDAWTFLAKDSGAPHFSLRSLPVPIPSPQIPASLLRSAYQGVCRVYAGFSLLMSDILLLNGIATGTLETFEAFFLIGKALEMGVALDQAELMACGWGTRADTWLSVAEDLVLSRLTTDCGQSHSIAAVLCMLGDMSVASKYRHAVSLWILARSAAMVYIQHHEHLLLESLMTDYTVIGMKVETAIRIAQHSALALMHSALQLGVPAAFLNEIVDPLPPPSLDPSRSLAMLLRDANAESLPNMGDLLSQAHATFCEGWKAFELARYLLRIEPLRPDVCIPWHSSDPSLICLKQADAPFVTDCAYALPITQVAHFHLTQFLVDPCPNVFTGVQYAFAALRLLDVPALLVPHPGQRSAIATCVMAIKCINFGGFAIANMSPVDKFRSGPLRTVAMLDDIEEVAQPLLDALLLVPDALVVQDGLLLRNQLAWIVATLRCPA